METILGNTAYSTTNLNFGGNSRSVTTYNSMQSSAHSPGVVASGANASDGNQDRNKSLTPEETEANIRSYCTSHQNELSCENKFGTNKSLTPGPFMVLQGLCGDGVQNTIDNAPAFPNDVMIRMMEASMADIAVPGSTVKDGSLDHVDIYDTISKCGYVAPSKKDVQSIADSISTWDTQSHRREQTYDIENLADKTEASSLFLQSFPYERDGKLCVYDSLPPMAVAASPQNSPEKKRYKRNGDVSDYPSYTFPTISEGETGAIKLTKVHCADTLSISLSQTSLDELNNSIFKNSESRSAPETFGENSSSRAFSHAEPNLVGTLRPGMIVTGVEIITLDPTNWCKSGIRPFVPAIFNDIKGKKAQTLRYLRIVSPYEGYILLSRGNWLFLTSGMPDVLCGGGNDGWAWRVVCRDGAFVRSGLDLLSDHKCTIPHGSLVRVTRRTINAYGLSRLMVEARKCDSVDSDVLIRLPIVDEYEESENNLQEKSSMSKSIQNGNGWISEMLNPLSGQRGPIVEPLPFPVPTIFKVVLEGGAVIRAAKELSSPVIRVAQRGELLRVVARAFSEHPQDRCLQRMQIAGDGGWISTNLNAAPPLDHPIVELIGEDSEFDPSKPGIYHLMASLESIKHIEKSDNHDRIKKIGKVVNTTPKQGEKLPSDGTKERLCLVCLTEGRNATIVHGGTGHICCCLECARILWARGDACPVCRMKIDLVIQHFEV